MAVAFWKSVGTDRMSESIGMEITFSRDMLLKHLDLKTE